MNNKWLGVGLGFCIVLTGCGSSDGNEDSKEFSQNVDRVPYSLNELQIEVSVGSREDSQANQLKKTLGVSGRARDEMIRLIKGSSFIITVNGVESNLQISSAGNINYQQRVAKNSPGCSLNGVSEVTGMASSLHLELDWDLKVDLGGGACDASMIEDYFKFQNDELSVFHMNSVNALIASADLPKDLQRSIHLRVKVSGDSH